MDLILMKCCKLINSNKLSFLPLNDEQAWQAHERRTRAEKSCAECDVRGAERHQWQCAQVRATAKITLSALFAHLRTPHSALYGSLVR